MTPRSILVPLLALAHLLAAPAPHAQAELPVRGVTVVKTYPHDTAAYTEGLFVLKGQLYESTGEIGASSIRRVDLASGKVLQQADTPPPYYGEGIIAAGDRLVQLTWRNRGGFIYDLASFKPLGVFTYEGEGWALTSDGKSLYMSDGTPTIRKLDPQTLKQTGQIQVTAEGKPLKNLNELEWVKGELWANVWLTSRIARIDPTSGKVLGWVELAPLVPKPAELKDPGNDVANGIAYDAERDKLYVTGKRWPRLYEIKLKRSGR
ncbi:glutaminyl-peptide cyclotransferase [Pseudoxanthomonas composti]|uniref:Glutaminyl-peptide cyclotransferase n=1 Tax=Pseudoxanthomonas composti TaxID=2137479 RepID=A0A4Q1JYG8_9GAMM|nr:glutaminyl-peptide cyclotransferase [Pseudoxanthomonas composti]RXR06474.1 glutaminyl-peptide cyclotransferase [Pseudoxanthomonas composti]